MDFNQFYFTEKKKRKKKKKSGKKSPSSYFNTAKYARNFSGVYDAPGSEMSNGEGGDSGGDGGE